MRGTHKAFLFAMVGLILLVVIPSIVQMAAQLAFAAMHQLEAGFEAHKITIIGFVVAAVALYVVVKIKLRRFHDRGREARVRPQPAFPYDPRRDRPGPIGHFGRFLAERTGGPIICKGTQPVRVLEPEEPDTPDPEPGEDEDPDPDGSEPRRRYSALEAHAIFNQAMKK